jgi:hypothetical protein
LLRFAEEAYAALVTREPDPIEAMEHDTMCCLKEPWPEAETPAGQRGGPEHER